MSTSITLPYGLRPSFPTTGWNDSAQSGNATFTSKNEFVEIYVSLTTTPFGSDNGTVLSNLESNPYFWPTSLCFVNYKVIVVAKPQSAYSQGIPPALSRSRHTASGTSPFSTGTRTFSIESLSPPYVFTLLNSGLNSYFHDASNSIPKIASSGAWDYALDPNTTLLDHSDWRTEPIAYGAGPISTTTRQVSSSSVTYNHLPAIGNAEFQKTSWLNGDTVTYGTSANVKFIQNLEATDIYSASSGPIVGVFFNATYSSASKSLRKETASTSATISLQVNL
jgi:hypothetical protein